MTLTSRYILSGLSGIALLGSASGVAVAQEDRFEALAEMPFEQNRPTEETARTLMEELTFSAPRRATSGRCRF